MARPSGHGFAELKLRIFERRLRSPFLRAPRGGKPARLEGVAHLPQPLTRPSATLSPLRASCGGERGNKAAFFARWLWPPRSARGEPPRLKELRTCRGPAAPHPAFGHPLPARRGERGNGTLATRNSQLATRNNVHRGTTGDPPLTPGHPPSRRINWDHPATRPREG
jgi:hypothetical protein